MRKADVDMNQVLQEVLKEIKQDNDGRDIEWVIANLPNVLGDDALLRLVWINLLSNAVKFTRNKEKARIVIDKYEGPEDFVFFVRDNGVGFDMQYSKKLFGVFQRLHSPEEFEGTGIGLANVRQIISKHQGRTWAEAEVDKGATFYFTVPKYYEEKL
jgi:chemotaxis family two-component system sensor kinase Cph1